MDTPTDDANLERTKHEDLFAQVLDGLVEARKERWTRSLLGGWEYGGMRVVLTGATGLKALVTTHGGYAVARFQAADDALDYVEERYRKALSARGGRVA